MLEKRGRTFAHDILRLQGDIPIVETCILGYRGFHELGIEVREQELNILCECLLSGECWIDEDHTLKRIVHGQQGFLRLEQSR